VEHKVFLSQRNISALLSKLDRTSQGDSSACTLIKGDNQHAEYPQTMARCRVTAVETSEDKQKYTSNQIYVDREELCLLRPGHSVQYQLSDSTDTILVTAVTDEAYYRDREPGYILEKDVKPVLAVKEDSEALDIASAFLSGLAAATARAEDTPAEEEETPSSDGGDSGGGASEDIPESEPETSSDPDPDTSSDSLSDES
jgi:hypothetical protein